MNTCHKCGAPLERLFGSGPKQNSWYCPKCPEAERDTKASELEITKKQLFAVTEVAARLEAEIEQEIAEFKGLNRNFNEARRQLREANARNAALVSALKNTSCRTDGDGQLCWCSDNQSGLFVTSHAQFCINARKAVSANSEAAAELEAARLEPMRREVVEDQLRIKELQDALRKLLQVVIHQVGAEYTDNAKDVLAKQPDTHKALLEWEMETRRDERLYLAQCFRQNDIGVLVSAEQIAHMLETMAKYMAKGE